MKNIFFIYKNKGLTLIEIIVSIIIFGIIMSVIPITMKTAAIIGAGSVINTRSYYSVNSITTEVIAKYNRIQLNEKRVPTQSDLEASEANLDEYCLNDTWCESNKNNITITFNIGETFMIDTDDDGKVDTPLDNIKYTDMIIVLKSGDFGSRSTINFPLEYPE